MLITRADLMSASAGVDAADQLNAFEPAWQVTPAELDSIEQEMCRERSTRPLEDFAYSLPGATEEIIPILDSILLEAEDRCDAVAAVEQQLQFVATLAQQQALRVVSANERKRQNDQICAVLGAGKKVGASELIAAAGRKLGLNPSVAVIGAVFDTCSVWIGPLRDLWDELF